MMIVPSQAVDLTPYGKPAFGRLPTGLGKPAAGFPQLHSLDDDVHLLSNLGLTLYRGILSRQRLSGAQARTRARKRAEPRSKTVAGGCPETETGGIGTDCYR